MSGDCRSKRQQPRPLQSVLRRGYARLGFSWQLLPKLVVRGGYGITDYFEGTGDAQRLTQNPPFLHQFYYQPGGPSASTPGTPLPVENGFNTSAGALSTASNVYEVYPKNLRPTFVQQFNLTTQYLINAKTTAQVGYVGEIGQRLIVPVQANEYTAVAADRQPLSLSTVWLGTAVKSTFRSPRHRELQCSPGRSQAPAKQRTTVHG